MGQSRNPNKIQIHLFRVSRCDYFVAVEICRAFIIYASVQYTTLGNCVRMFRSHMWNPHINIHAQRHSCWYHLPVYICFQPFAASLVFKHISATIGGFGTFQCWISYLCTCHDLCYLINSVSLLAGPNCLDHYTRNESHELHKSYHTWFTRKTDWRKIEQTFYMHLHIIIWQEEQRHNVQSKPDNTISIFMTKGAKSLNLWAPISVIMKQGYGGAEKMNKLWECKKWFVS